jgi:threonine dehydrogenase-like Zn-dependent dehydrogenase
VTGAEVRSDRMRPVYDFCDQVALVTGAAAGMGLATARAFAGSGAAVVLADRDEQTLERATAELTAEGHQAVGVGCDVSDEEQVAVLGDTGSGPLRRSSHRHRRRARRRRREAGRRRSSPRHARLRGPP